MASTAIAFVVVTIFWAIIGAVVPWFIKAGPNKGFVLFITLNNVVLIPYIA